MRWRGKMFEVPTCSENLLSHSDVTAAKGQGKCYFSPHFHCFLFGVLSSLSEGESLFTGQQRKQTESKRKSAVDNNKGIDFVVVVSHGRQNNRHQGEKNTLSFQ